MTGAPGVLPAPLPAGGAGTAAPPARPALPPDPAGAAPALPPGAAAGESPFRSDAEVVAATGSDAPGSAALTLIEPV
jgi:hypothetical protein